jgi:hypothetical protein
MKREQHVGNSKSFHAAHYAVMKNIEAATAGASV